MRSIATGLVLFQRVRIQTSEGQGEKESNGKAVRGQSFRVLGLHAQVYFMLKGEILAGFQAGALKEMEEPSDMVGQGGGLDGGPWHQFGWEQWLPSLPYSLHPPETGNPG